MVTTMAARGPGGMWTTWGQDVHGLGTAREPLGEGTDLGMEHPRCPQAEMNFHSSAELGGRPSVHIPTGPMTMTRFSYSLIS